MIQLPFPRNYYLPLGISLVIGGGLTIIATLMVGNWQLQSAKHEFEEQADHFSQHFQGHLDQYSQVTNALGIFYKASDNVTRRDFRTFAQPWLAEYPEILGIAWAKRITEDQRITYEQTVKAEGLTQFKIRDRNSQTIGKKSEYFPLTYGEPSHVYQSHLGVDLGAIESLQPSLSKARDSGEIVAAQGLPLLTGKSGLILLNPVYLPGTAPTTIQERQQQFMGVVATVYQLKNLLEKALKDVPHYQLSFAIFDSLVEENKHLLLTFEAKAETITTADTEEHSYSFPLVCQKFVDCRRSLNVADHQWSLIVTPNFNLLQILAMPGAVFLLGLSLTGLWGMYLWNTLSEKAYIEKLVAQRTAELRKTTDELEIRVQERTAQLQAANDGKNELIGQIGHEFRNPLTIILGFIDLLDGDRHLSDKQQQNLTIMRRNGEYLLTLFNNFLEISQLETQRDFVSLTTFNLQGLVNTVMEIVGLKAQGKNLPVTFDLAPEVPLYIKADENKLQQILVNLLDNAIKFTDEGEVTLRIIRKDQDLIAEDSEDESSVPSLLYFEVEDTGTGITSDIQGQVLEPFVRGTTRQGAGLGLSIAHKLIQLMGGEIEILSPVNNDQGTLLRFYLPLILPDATEVPPIQPIKHIIGLALDQPTYRLLVVEEQSDQRQLLTTFLTSLGFQVKETSSEEETVEIWFDWRPHLIIINAEMPFIDAYQSLREIKKLTHTHPTIIFGLTDDKWNIKKMQKLASVCDQILHQPLDMELLLNKMATYLGVDYQYETLESVEQVPEILGTSLQASSLQVMPPEWIQAVYQAASEGNSQQLYQLIEKIPDENRSLTFAMTELVDHFNFRQLRKLSFNNPSRDEVSGKLNL